MHAGFCYSNQFTDMTPLAGLINLEELTLGLNNINDISLLAGLVNLIVIDLYQNQISDISPLANMVNLSIIGLSVNQISDISALVSNPGIGSGDWIYLGLNPLSAASCNTYIPALNSRGVSIEHDCP
jgi:Leucine-rich repeat (LRR) protein